MQGFRRISRKRAEELWLGLQFMAGLPLFLHRSVREKAAREALRRRLEQRQALFMDLVCRTVYAVPSSPYLHLLRRAGCEPGDLEKLVRQAGVEGALKVLCRNGIYLTVEEFKGRRPMVRGSARFSVDPHLFRNPACYSWLGIRTSGSRSRGIHCPVNFAYIRSRSTNALLDLSARGGLRWRHGVWGIPGGSALIHLLEYSGCGARPVRWFSHVDPASCELDARYRSSAQALRWISLLAGRPMPRLQHATAGNPVKILEWMTRVRRSGHVPHLLTYVSPAVQLCQAAEDAGADISGAQLTLTGEPVTAVRLDAIRRAGAAATPRYGSAESGTIGYGCLRPEAPDEVHLLHDRLALIQTEEDDRRSGTPTGSLLVTTLLPATPFILLNVSLGDQAVLMERDCGCSLQGCGWTTHLHAIRSYEKLTVGGMNFLDTEVARIMDEVLPQRFGGGPTHYQLVEEEDADGRSHLRLLVHPAVGPVDSGDVAETFLRAISPGSGIEKIMGTVWRDARLLTVQRTPPLATLTGKILHIHADRKTF